MAWSICDSAFRAAKFMLRPRAISLYARVSWAISSCPWTGIWAEKSCRAIRRAPASSRSSGRTKRRAWCAPSARTSAAVIAAMQRKEAPVERIGASAYDSDCVAITVQLEPA